MPKREAASKAIFICPTMGQFRRKPPCLLLTALLGLCRAFSFNALTSLYHQTLVQIGSYLWTNATAAAFRVSWTLACLMNLIAPTARVPLLGTGRNGDMSSLGFRSGDSWEWSSYLFAISPVGEDTVPIRTHIPFVCTRKAHSRDLGGHLEKSVLQESLGFTLCKRLWPASVLSICSSRTQRSTGGRVPTHPVTCCHFPYSFCKCFPRYCSLLILPVSSNTVDVP